MRNAKRSVREVVVPMIVRVQGTSALMAAIEGMGRKVLA